MEITSAEKPRTNSAAENRNRRPSLERRRSANIVDEKPFGDANRPFVIGVIFMQALMIVLYAIGTDYTYPNTNEAAGTLYMYFQNIHVMVFVGFGFLMVFPRKMGFSSVVYTFIISVLVIQWSMLLIYGIHGIANKNFHEDESAAHIMLDMSTIINGDFAAAAIMISIGALIGKVTPFQLLILAVCETIAYAVNLEIVMNHVQIVDIGGSITIHLFGAYFGLVASKIVSRPKSFYEGNGTWKDLATSYHSDLIAFIGTVFLWINWPSFNAALAPEPDGAGQLRSIINTLLSICASCMSTAVVSLILRHGKFAAVDLQNATLAGGVAMGCSAHLYLHPAVAFGLGSFTGVVSSVGFARLTPILEEKIGLLDTCGIHNLHGMPGLIGGLASIVAVGAAPLEAYGSNLSLYLPLIASGDRNRGDQAGAQMAGILITLLIATVGAVITGFIMRMAPYPTVDFSDASSFEVPHAELATFFKGGLREKDDDEVTVHMNNVHPQV